MLHTLKPRFRGKGNVRGKLGSAVNRGLACLQYMHIKAHSVNRNFTIPANLGLLWQT